MINESVWHEIEGPLLRAVLGVVSTPRAFDAALFKVAPVSRLLGELDDRESCEKVQKRLLLLLGGDADPRYCHPHDLAIAIYLRALDICAPELAFPPARQILAHRNLWWARAMALRLLAEPQREIRTQSHRFSFPGCGPAVLRYEHVGGSPLPSAAEMRSPATVSARQATVTDSGSFQAALDIGPLHIRSRPPGAAV